MEPICSSWRLINSGKHSLAFQQSQPEAQLNCAEIVRRVQNGDDEAFALLVDRYQERVFNTALRMIGDYDEADDITQEAFLNCYRKLDSFRGDSQFTTWIYRITINVVKNRWKYKLRRGANKTFSLHAIKDPEEQSLEEQLPSEQPSPRQIAQDSELQAILMRKMDELHPDFREVLVLRCLESLSYNEIAEILECSIGTVKSRLHRAREILKEKMEKYL